MNPPPPRNDTVEFQKADGSWCLGWATYDGVRGWRYFTRSADAPPPSGGITSRFDIVGTHEFYPVAWRPYQKPKIDVPVAPLSQREVEVILKRAILTDGTLRATGQDKLRTSWEDWSVNAELALVDQINLDIFERFIPEPFDRDNYLIGMDWLARINKKAKGFLDLNREQNAVVWRAYDFPFEWIGTEILGGVSRQRARDVYRSAIERAWALAVAAPEPVWRLPRHVWDK